MTWPHPPQGQPQYPQYPQHPLYAPPPQPQYGNYPQPREGIVVTTAYMPLSWMFALVKPKIVVDGRQMPTAGWGRTVVPAPPTTPSSSSRANGWNSSTRCRSGPSAPVRSGRRPRPTTTETAMIVVSVVALLVVFAAILVLALAA